MRSLERIAFCERVGKEGPKGRLFPDCCHFLSVLCSRELEIRSDIIFQTWPYLFFVFFEKGRDQIQILILYLKWNLVVRWWSSFFYVPIQYCTAVQKLFENSFHD